MQRNLIEEGPRFEREAWNELYPPQSHMLESFSQPSEGTSPADTCNFRLPDLEDNALLLFKSYHLLYFATAVLAN